jgi:hypothetical protein
VINGFWYCQSVERIEFPSNVEIVNGFSDCHSLSEVVFKRDSQVREIHGFCFCLSPKQMEITPSTKLLF